MHSLNMMYTMHGKCDVLQCCMYTWLLKSNVLVF